MKKLYQYAGIYAIAGIAGGVFYREFTKFNAFYGQTALGFLHVHLLVLGMLFFLLLMALEKLFSLTKSKSFSKMLRCYHPGLVTTAVTLLLRGIVQVLGLSLTRGADASLSGIAGIGHILLAAGLFFFFQALKEQAVPKSAL